MKIVISALSHQSFMRYKWDEERDSAESKLLLGIQKSYCAKYYKPDSLVLMAVRFDLVEIEISIILLAILIALPIWNSMIFISLPFGMLMIRKRNQYKTVFKVLFLFLSCFSFFLGYNSYRHHRSSVMRKHIRFLSKLIIIPFSFLNFFPS